MRLETAKGRLLRVADPLLLMCIIDDLLAVWAVVMLAKYGVGHLAMRDQLYGAVVVA